MPIEACDRCGAINDITSEACDLCGAPLVYAPDRLFDEQLRQQVQVELQAVRTAAVPSVTSSSLIDPEKRSVNRGVKYWLRWMAVLPACLGGALLTVILLHFFAYNTLNHLSIGLAESLERFLTPGTFTAGFIIYGVRVAPEGKVFVAIGLLGLMLFLIGGAFFMGLTKTETAGGAFYLTYYGFGTLVAVAGAALGFYISVKDSNGQ